ncbi:MAG TPA: diaminopimelate decarboxylase [Thermoanaerobaculia bacterium]|nr:diaminopimelate decarboxylase [Thermoanaerobaculia bacterium]
MEFRDGILHIGGVSVLDIVERFGSPVYVYDADVILRQIERVKRAFAALPFRPFYAMKANGNLGILRLIRAHGFGCDSVSPGEIFLAEKAGYAPDEIWFTCSNVSDDDLRKIPDPRIVINVNSMSEIDRALSLDLENPIALRVNTDIGAGHHHDVITAGGGVKFGIDMAEVEDARIVVEDAGRRIVGLHAHIGSGIDSVEPLIGSAERLVELSPDFEHLRFINFGGGIGVPYRPSDREFPIDDYGHRLEHVAGKVVRVRALQAILEPGRYVVAESGTLVARITSRRVSAGVNWVGCDTGFNHLVRPSKYGAYHHIVNATRGSNASLRASFDDAKMGDDVVVSGNLCESGDVFTRDATGNAMTRHVDAMHVGDLVALCDAGAYGFSMASHYNGRLLPPEVLIEDGRMRAVRHRQSYEELMAGME